jgi:hypothetical protein
MAHYLVTAMPVEKNLESLREKLQEEAFISLRPFGRALTYSLVNAKWREDGYAVWEEEDYCSPPLKEEREAVLDKYFEDIQVEEVEKGKGWSRISRLPRLFPELKDD